MSAAVGTKLRRVLLLGSGYTSAPLIEYLTRDGTVAVTVGEDISSTKYPLQAFDSSVVASNILEQAQNVAAPFKNTSTALVDVTSDSSLSSLIPGHNLVIR